MLDTSAKQARIRSMGKRRVTSIAVLVVSVALLAVACSSGRSSSSGGSTSTTGAATSFGTMPSPCGGGDAKGSTQQGVTDSAVTIGYGDDAGYAAAPGLNKEIADAVKAMIKWCNGQGCINGRQVVGNYYDAKILESNNAMTEACGQVFMLVGEGWALDGASEKTRLACSLAAVPTYSVSPEFANAPLMVQPTPNPVDYYDAANAFLLAERFPTQTKKVAILAGDYPGTIDSAEKAKLAYQQAGWQFLDCDQKYAITGEATYGPIVQKLKDCGAQVVLWSGSPAPIFENVLDAAKQVGFDPIWTSEANNYDSSFAAWNTSGNADNVYVRMTYYPFDQAADHSATQQYLDLIKTNGGSTSLLGAQATAAFLLWAQGAKDCGSTLTSECVLTNLRKVTNYDAGGLQSPTNPGANQPGDCAMVVKLTGTKYEQVLPATIGTQTCDPKYLVKIAGPVVDRAQLDSNRVSQIAK
jgi:ABC-type branched-subunit amino acid transport system substrate-binding protein